MVSFRFHVVSLVAVFIAIALGIAVGATVVDRATVELLERQVDEVAGRLDRTDAENESLRQSLGTWQRFAEESGERFVAGRLADASVVLVAVRGSDADADAVARLRASLDAAGALVAATVWVDERFSLAGANDVADLATAIGVSPPPSSDPDGDTGSADDAAAGAEADAEAEAAVAAENRLRRESVSALAAGLTGAGPSVMAPLHAAGFVNVEAAGGATDVVTDQTTRFVVVSSADANVNHPLFAVPLASELVRLGGRRVVAAEPGRAASDGLREVRADFVSLLRRGEIAEAVSTVDNLEDYRGRVATVLALADLSEGRVGHYGIGPRATQLLPPVATPAP